MANDISIADILYVGCKRFTERRLGIPLTDKEFDSYAEALSKQQDQEEIEESIYTLEQSGYTVIPPNSEGE